MLLPVFPDEIKLINSLIGFVKKNNYIYYFNGQMPIFHHTEDDLNSFKMFVSQLYICGNASQSDIVRAFGISNSSIKRWVKKYRKGGPSAFFNKTVHRTAKVMTPQKIAEIQSLLDSEEEVDYISKLTGVKKATILKGIYQKKTA
ncbi:MAG: helix-turn-helix domain-containing protein [Candidatus Cloacimonetes bacterium]|nr:helix-turn-helix domain-containing protein [Candidatus Cloacimonadota bacterium]